jgi:hypothetical protein
MSREKRPCKGKGRKSKTEAHEIVRGVLDVLLVRILDRKIFELV